MAVWRHHQLCHCHYGRRAERRAYHNRMPVVFDDLQFDDWMRGTSIKPRR